MQFEKSSVNNNINETSNINIRALDFIDCGVIDYYYGLKFETDYSFDKLVSLIGKKIDSVLDNYFQTIKTSFQKDVKEVANNVGLSNYFTFKDLDDTNEFVPNQTDNINTNSEIDDLEFEFTANGLKIRAIPKTQKHIQDLYNRSNASYEQSKTIYGEPYVNAQHRLFLPPFRAVLSNGKTDYIEGILYIFKNYSAVLRLTIPLKNIDSRPLFEYNYSAYISKFINVCDMNIEPLDNSIDSLKDCYCNFLVQTEKNMSILSFGSISSIILSKHHSMVKNIKYIPKDLKEDIFKILIAPTPNRKNTNYYDEAEQCFKTSSFTLNGTCSIVCNMNKCITIIDDSIRNAGMEIFPKDIVYERLNDDVRDSLEFAFCILMLKRINNHYTFYKKGFFGIT